MPEGRGSCHLLSLLQRLPQEEPAGLVGQCIDKWTLLFPSSTPLLPRGSGGGGEDTFECRTHEDCRGGIFKLSHRTCLRFDLV